MAAIWIFRFHMVFCQILAGDTLTREMFVTIRKVSDLHMLYAPRLQYRQSQQGTMFSDMAWSPTSSPNFSPAPTVACKKRRRSVPSFEWSVSGLYS